MKFFCPVGILLQRMMTMPFFESLENEMSVTDCVIIDSELHVQHFFKEAWRNHYPNGFTIEAIAVCLTKVYWKTFLLIYSHERN